MKKRRFTAAVLGLTILGASAVVSAPAAWATAKPVIAHLKATPSTVRTLDGTSTISASVSNATSCTLKSKPALLSGTGPVSCSGGSVSQVLVFPENTSHKTAKYKITLTATGPGGRKAKKVKVKVLPGAGGGSAPSITSASKTTFYVGESMSFGITTTGDPAPAITETGSLPSVVSFTDNHNGTATLAGTPSSGTQGTYPIMITAANGVLPNATQNFTLLVKKAAKPVINHLKASPSKVTTLDGTSTISASVSNATSCTLSSKPALLSGAGPVSCSGGSVSQVVAFKENTSHKTVKYKITLTATGPGGHKAKKVKVKVLPGAGGS